MPAMAIFSGYHAFNNHWAMMASLTYTGWHVFKKMTLHFKDQNPNLDNNSDAKKTPDATTIEDFRDTYKYALGLNYSPTRKTTWRAGVAYDMTPARKHHRTIRLPDSNRIWVTIGTHHEFTKHFSADVGYAHIFFRNNNVSETVIPDPSLPFLSNYVAGTYRHSYANLVGVQVNWLFG